MFSVTEMRDFEMFSLSHIVTLILFLLTFCTLVYYRKKLQPYQKTIKWVLFSMLLICELSLHLWLIVTKQWDASDLPVQLCSLSTFLALFLFLKKSDKVFNLLFFIGIFPPILSMVTPEIGYHFPHFRFLKYFLHHSAIPLSVLYFILFEGYRVPKRAILYSYVCVNIIAVPVFFLNQQLDTNFFYLASPTESKTILSFLGNGIMYYINLEIIAIFVFIITYIPMGMLLRKENMKRENG